MGKFTVETVVKSNYITIMSYPYMWPLCWHKEVHPPNWIDKLREISYEQKVIKAINKCQRHCDLLNAGSIEIDSSIKYNKLVLDKALELLSKDKEVE